MHTSSDEDSLNLESFKKFLGNTFTNHPDHQQKVMAVCLGDTIEAMRTNVNRRIRTAIALDKSTYTGRKFLALDSLDCNAPINEWLMDFERVVAPYVSEKVDPDRIT